MNHKDNILIFLKKKTTRNFRDYGFFISLKKIISHLIKPIYEKRRVLIFKIDLTNINKKEINKKSLNCKTVKLTDTYILQQIEDMEEWLAGKMESNINKGKLCLALLNNSKVIGFYLISLGEIDLPLLRLKVILEKNEAFGEQITIHKKYRRKGLATELRHLAYMELKRQGIEKFYATVAVDNLASIRSVKKVGGQILGTLLYKGLLETKQLQLIGKDSKQIFNLQMKIKDIRKIIKDMFGFETKSNEQGYFTANTADFYLTQETHR